MEGLEADDEILYPIEIDEYGRSDPFHYVDPIFTTGIMKDVLLDNKEEVLHKISQGKSVRVIDNNGKSLLHLAVQAARDDMSMIDLLLQQEETDINAADFRMSTPLTDSIRLEKSDVAIHLINAGADVNMPRDHNKPLHYGVKNDLRDVCKALIEAGADLDAPDQDGDTPLHLAVYYRQFELMCMLLCNGATLTKNGENYTPFTLSVEKELQEYAEVLVEYETTFESNTVEFVIRRKHRYLLRLLSRIIEEDPNLSFTANTGCMLSLLDNLDAFVYIWQNFQMDIDFNNFFRHMLCNRLPRNIDFNRVLYALMNSRKYLMKQLVEYSMVRPFLLTLLIKLPPFDKSLDVYEVCAVFLSHGIGVWDVDLDFVFQVYGNCELFKVLLHMDIIRTNLPKQSMMGYLKYSVHKGEHLRATVSKDLFRFTDLDILQKDYEYLYRFTALPPFDEFNLENFALEVPKLTELARNQLRYHLCVKYRVIRSRDFYTLLKYMPFANYVKKILSLEIPIYNPIRPNELDEIVYIKRFELYDQMLVDYKLGFSTWKP